MNSNTLFQAAAELELRGTPFVIVTLLSVQGHAPQDPGAKAIVTQSGLYTGTVGGGKVEARAIQHAQSLLNKKNLPPELVNWNLQRDIGMTCGGQVQFLFELHDRLKWPIVVFGAGHVAQALVRSLEPLDCQITVIDHRSEWIEKMPRSAKIKTILCESPPEQVAKLSGDSFFVVMTQGHASDLPVLEAIFKTHPQAPYVGVMGSDIKAKKIRQDLLERGIDQKLIECLHCPIGFPIGQNAPAEIAISVAAQLLKMRDGTRDGTGGQ